MTRRWAYTVLRWLLGEHIWAAARAVRHAHRRRKRDPRERLLKQLPRGAVCAEIGVWTGEFSERILRRTRPKLLHLIDPWQFQPQYPERYYGGKIAGNQGDMDRVFDDLRTRFANEPRVVVHRGMSRDVLSTFANAYFDWVYIDGNHSYEFVINDLRLCLAKTKPGGVIAGDDYMWAPAEAYPVRRAVQVFVEENGLSENLTTIGSQFVISLPTIDPLSARSQ